VNQIVAKSSKFQQKTQALSLLLTLRKYIFIDKKYLPIFALIVRHGMSRCEMTIHRRRVSSRKRGAFYLQIWKQYQKGYLRWIPLSPFRRIAQKRPTRLSSARECRSARKKTIAPLAEARRQDSRSLCDKNRWILCNFCFLLSSYLPLSRMHSARLYALSVCLVLKNKCHNRLSWIVCHAIAIIYSNADIIIETFQRI